MPVKISKILKDNGIRKLYHFTDRANLQSIIQHGGLYSWEDCAIKGIVIPRSGSNEVSRSLDRQHGLQDYVRLSFTRNHPMMYAAIKEQRINDPVILEIDVAIADKQNTLFSDRNATKNMVNIGAGLQYFNKIHLSTVIQNYPFNLSESEKEFYQAEVLVKNFIPLDLILNISDFIDAVHDSLTIETTHVNNGWEYKGCQNQLTPWAYDKVCDFSEGLAGIMKEDKWGFIDKAGREIIPCRYDRVRSFREGFAAVAVYGMEEDGDNEETYRKLLWGFIDNAGREVVPCIYVDVSSYYKGLAAVCSSGLVVVDDEHYEDYRILFGKWGFVDENGTEVIPCIYDDVSHFSDGLALIEKDGKYGYIDKTGNEIIPCHYRAATSFSEGLASVSFGVDYDPNSKWGFIDENGTEVIPCIYKGMSHFSDGLALIEKDGKLGYIDKTGNEIIPIGCVCCVNKFSEGLVAIETNGIWDFADKTGNVLISNVCRDDWDQRPVSDFSDGFARILNEHGWKFIDKSGTEVIHIDKNKFNNDSQECDKGNVVSYVGDFHEGLAKITQYPFYYDSFYREEEEYKSGFIDKTGTIVIPCIYDSACDFSEGLARVGKKGKYGFINREGTEIVSCIYDDFRDFSEGFAAVAVYVNGILKWGFIDTNGRAIIPHTISEPILNDDYPDEWPCPSYWQYLSEQISNDDYPDDDLPF